MEISKWNARILTVINFIQVVPLTAYALYGAVLGAPFLTPAAPFLSTVVLILALIFGLANFNFYFRHSMDKVKFDIRQFWTLGPNSDFNSLLRADLLEVLTHPISYWTASIIIHLILSLLSLIALKLDDNTTRLNRSL